ncbi:MAG: FtsW/RodA/SpoVE family cell cycle protein, partial [Polyangiaceae bacterium]
QTIWIVLGLIGAGMVAAMDLRFLRRISGSIYQMLVVLLIAVLLFGREINHSRRWIELGPANLQPSEFMKVCLIIALAKYLHDDPKNEERRLRDLAIPGILTAEAIRRSPTQVIDAGPIDQGAAAAGEYRNHQATATKPRTNNRVMNNTIHPHA